MATAATGVGQLYLGCERLPDLNNLVRERIDLIGLADEVIDGVDLQAIIRQSTATVTENVMSDVRTQGERADDMVSGFVDRLLGRQPEPR